VCNNGRTTKEQRKQHREGCRYRTNLLEPIYAHTETFDLKVPSQFCVLVATEVDKAKPLVEFGCGNGRDSLYLDAHGFKVFAGDLSKEAIAHNQTRSDKATFEVVDVSNAKQVTGLIDKARQVSDEASKNVVLFNRFFLHSLDDTQERSFLQAMAAATKTGDVLYMEFRHELDVALNKVFHGHFRRYVEMEKKLVPLLQELGFKVTYQYTGQGMAKYKSEDPVVSRVIAERI
jgi:SAM-dependent methyltransferase